MDTRQTAPSIQPTLYKHGRWWYARIRLDVGKWRGFNTRILATASESGALAVAEEMQRRADRGAPPVDESTGAAPTPAAKLTLRALVERFLSVYTRGKIKDVERYRYEARSDIARWILPFLGDRLAADLRTSDVDAWLNWLQKEAPVGVVRQGEEDTRRRGYGNGVVNLALARLSAVYTWAIRSDILTCKHPVSGRERLRTRPRDDFYPIDEVHQILRLSPDGLPLHLAAAWYMVATALYTGMRHGELRALRWVHVDFLGGVIEVRDNWVEGRLPKNGEPRSIPLHAELVPWLRRWRAQCPDVEGLVFPVAKLKPPSRETIDSWQRAKEGEHTEHFREVLRRAGAHNPVAPLHVLRHTFITQAARARMPREALEIMVGHASSGSAVTSGYMHLGLDFLQEALRTLTLAPPELAGVIDLDKARSAKRRAVQQAPARAAAQSSASL